jgi:phosphomannomutase / phosphoglucomutase
MEDNMVASLACFKAYDIRGKVPEELNEDLAYKIGRAYVAELNPQTVVVGYDIRLESQSIANALKNGIIDAGADVMDIGLCGTEEIYFSTFYHQMDGGIMVTASHNPKGFNGMKLVKQDARPISGDSGLGDIEKRVINEVFTTPKRLGKIESNYNKTAYVDHLLSYVNTDSLKPLKVVMNAGNGSAGAVIRQIAAELPFECIFINEHPDGEFPNGVPNPLLQENRASTSDAVKKYNADFGIAWDGDFDRCFLFDENGDFIEGYYLVGLLAATLLAKNPAEKIIHDPRLTWNTIEQVTAAGGVPVMSKTGHAFIKERMRLEDAIYGGEMSAHHYFKDFSYCDSGMIPWFLVAELISKTGKSLSQLVADRMRLFPCSGEINYKVDNVPAVLEKVMKHYSIEKPKVDKTDGISLDFDEWRMNIRASNTEPLLRLNIETRADEELLWEKAKEMETLISEA